ncbi:MAG: transketolase C-terminal domain-containing protein, partial [Acidimicrobiales bacterium]
PIIIALDQAIGQDAATTDPFDTEDVEVDFAKRLTADDLAELSEYRRYLVTPDGVSPWAVPGTPGGMNLVTGNEHNEWGQVSADPQNRLAMVEKRERKIASVHSLLPRARRWGPGDAPVGLLGIGMETGVIVEARERLETLGLSVDVLQPRTLWPVLDETVDFVATRELVFVVEHNAHAQLARLLTTAGAPSDKIRSLTRFDGVPFTPGEVVEALKPAMAGATAQ